MGKIDRGTLGMKRVDVMVAGQRVRVLAHVYPSSWGDDLYVVYGDRMGGDGHVVSRLPDGTELVRGLDRDVAQSVAVAMAALKNPKLKDLQVILRAYLGSFAL